LEVRRLKRQSQITVFDVGKEPPPDFCPSGWSAYLFEALAIDGLAIVASELHQPRPGLRLAELAELADQLTHHLHEGSHESQSMSADDRNPGQRTSEWSEGDDDLTSHDELPAEESLSRLRSTIAVASPNLDRSSGPSTTHVAPTREVLEQLEHLDDLVFETINGRQPALEELTQCWPALAKQLPAELLAESREQYLRYAIKLWQSQRDDGPRDPAWAIAALDVLNVLFGE
ncbi:MAG: hypothetical protein WBW33_31185, partial [Bryobacteraceae bacterium]